MSTLHTISLVSYTIFFIMLVWPNWKWTQKIPLWVISPMTSLSYIGIALTEEKVTKVDLVFAFVYGAIFLFLTLINHEHRLKLRSTVNNIELATVEQIDEFVNKLSERYKSFLKQGTVQITETIQ